MDRLLVTWVVECIRFLTTLNLSSHLSEVRSSRWFSISKGKSGQEDRKVTDKEPRQLKDTKFGRSPSSEGHQLEEGVLVSQSLIELLMRWS